MVETSDREHDSTQPRVRKVGQPIEVPVYNCRVYVAPADADGVVTARAANLDGIAGRGRSEREALQQVVAAFKQRIVELRQAETPIPWIEPPSPPNEGEQQRWIAVHL